jgi:hypothetical protein
MLVGVCTCLLLHNRSHNAEALQQFADRVLSWISNEREHTLNREHSQHSHGTLTRELSQQSQGTLTRENSQQLDR